MLVSFIISFPSVIKSFKDLLFLAFELGKGWLSLRDEFGGDRRTFPKSGAEIEPA